jgi:hypothetical protein
MATAGNTTFNLSSNTNWTCSSDATWCQVTPSGNGNGTITANYLENTLATTRTATISVSANGATTQTVKVVQSASFVSIEDNPESIFRLYPNPTTGIFKITGKTDASADVNITIYESSGCQVTSYHSKGKPEYSFDLSAYPKGIYIVKVETIGKLITWKLSLL